MRFDKRKNIDSSVIRETEFEKDISPLKKTRFICFKENTKNLSFNQENENSPDKFNNSNLNMAKLPFIWQKCSINNLKLRETIDRRYGEMNGSNVIENRNEYLKDNAKSDILCFISSQINKREPLSTKNNSIFISKDAHLSLPKVLNPKSHQNQKLPTTKNNTPHHQNSELNERLGILKKLEEWAVFSEDKDHSEIIGFIKEDITLLFK